MHAVKMRQIRTTATTMMRHFFAVLFILLSFLKNHSAAENADREFAQYERTRTETARSLLPAMCCAHGDMIKENRYLRDSKSYGTEHFLLFRFLLMIA